MAEVMVAMSGGVDSSVAALLMLEAGHRVTGVTLKLRTGPHGDAPTQGCCTAADAIDARRVADTLGIPYYVFDVTEGFEAAVVEPFIDGYRRGETPNPCVECNRAVKFSLLLDRATALGCDLLVTGHHARRRSGPHGWELWRATDRSKDQSYVLHMLGQHELARCDFPVGELTKAAVRERAAAAGLRTAGKAESQDACFLGPGGVRAFLRGLVAPGDVVDGSGAVVGRHAGAVTVGQRRGLGVPAGHRVFVTNITGTTVTIGEDHELWKRRLALRQVSWVSGRAPDGPVLVQVRAHGEPVPGWVEGNALLLDEPVRAPAPGQSAAVYAGDRLLGGGVIASAA